MSSRTEILLLLQTLSDAYPTFSISEGTADAYVRNLRDLEIGLLLESASTWIQTSRFFPTIADLRATYTATQNERIRLENFNNARRPRLEERHLRPLTEEERTTAHALTDDLLRQLGIPTWDRDRPTTGGDRGDSIG